MFVLLTVQSTACRAQTVWPFFLRELFVLNADVLQKRKLSAGTKHCFQEFDSCAQLLCGCVEG